MTEPDLFRELPETRASWELLYPGLQSRYLAWCNAERIPPYEWPGYEFEVWIGQRLAAFRLERGLKDQSLSEADHAAFTAWLWGE